MKTILIILSPALSGSSAWADGMAAKTEQKDQFKEGKYYEF